MSLTAAASTWIDHGACRGIDPVLFHPERGEPTKEAKAVCAACTVRVECLAWALAIDQKHGIYGGTSERDRRGIRRRLAAGEHVPELDPLPDPPATKEPAVDLAVATPEPAAAAPTNGARPTDPKTGLPIGVCVNCGKRYTPVRRDQRFHSKECARAWYASHPKTETGERQPRIQPRRVSNKIRVAKAVGLAPDVPDTAPPLPGAASGAVDLHALLGQLLAGCDHWTIQADLGDVGDVHLTISRDVTA